MSDILVAKEQSHQQVDIPATILEKVALEGDLAVLTPQERLVYYRAVCESMGLNPLTQPFGYIKLQGKLQLYAKRAAADQLRKIYSVSVEVVEEKREDDLYIVKVHASMPDGRTDGDIGVVPIAGLKGNELANAMMKAITKAKRRATLSICGLGWLVEPEEETIEGAQVVKVNSNGEIIGAERVVTVPQAKELPDTQNVEPAEPVAKQNGNGKENGSGNGNGNGFNRLVDAAAEYGLLKTEKLREAFAQFMKDTFKTASRHELSRAQVDKAVELIADESVREAIKEMAEQM